MRNQGMLAALILLAALASAHADPAVEATLVEQALRSSPEYTRPLRTQSGSPVSFVRDLDRDGLTDVAVITVLAEPGIPDLVTTHQSASRLFLPADEQPLYLVETYFGGDEAVHTVELGRWPALGSVEIIELTSGGEGAVALAVQTRSPRGDQLTLLVYSPQGRIRRLELRANQRERYHLADLTGDEVLDVLVARRLPEAGRGYETFLELLVLRSGAFESEASFPVVRELRAFLEATASDMIAGRWEQLANRAYRGNGVEVAHDEPEKMLDQIFTGVPNEDELSRPFDHAESGDGITAVMLPVLLENPFPFPFVGTSFSLLFRVETEDGAARLYSATIALAANPFETPRFAFLTPDNLRQ